MNVAPTSAGLRGRAGRLRRWSVGAALVLGMLGAACGGGSDPGHAGDDRPLVAVSTSILADVVADLVGDDADVLTLVPAGADPHGTQLSAREAARLRDADAVVVNGGGLEAGLADVLDAVADEGLPVHAAIDDVEVLAARSEAHDGAAEHADHDHPVDPHFVTDPVRMIAAVDGISEFLGEQLPGLAASVTERASALTAELELLDDELATLVGRLSSDRRLLVTNHDVLGYFADRYGFEVIGTVLPGGSTFGAGDAGALVDLASLVERRGVSAVFVDASSAADLAETVATEVGGVEVVALHTESLGPPGSGADTYVAYLRSLAAGIVGALR